MPWAPAKARLDETLIRALARAHRWKRMSDVFSDQVNC
jgi:pentatricopeptide repeat protein